MDTPRIEPAFYEAAHNALAQVTVVRPRSLAAACRLISSALRDGRRLDSVMSEAMDLLELGGWGDQRNPEIVLAREMFQRLCVEAFRARAAQNELERAAAVQRSWAPGESTIEASGYQVAGHLDSAAPCGGDMWDARPLAGGGLLVAIGDVTGSGLDAAMVVAAARGALGVACRLLRPRSVSPADVLRVMNGAVCEVGGGRLNMTCTVVVAYEDGTVIASGASHPLPYIVRADGSLGVLGARGPTLGDPDASYENVRAELAPRDSLLLYTDGVVECRDPRDVEFGHRRVRQFLRTSPRSPVGVARDSLYVALMNHRRGQPERDDLSYVLLRRSARASTLVGIGDRRRRVRR